MKTENKQIRAVWAKRITEQMVSGERATKWCTQRNLSIHSFRYWRKRLEALPRNGAETIRWLELVPDSSATLPRKPTPSVPVHELVAALIIRIGGAAIEVRKGFDPDLLRDVVQALYPR